MPRAYRHLLLAQSLLALANATAAVFGIVFLLKRDGFSVLDLVAFSLLEFATATGTCVALERMPPRRGISVMTAGLGVLIASYAAFLVVRGWPLLLFVAVAWGLYIPLFFLPFNRLVVGTTGAEDRAGRIGSFILAYTAVAIAAPTLGGAIVEAAGYGVLFTFALAVLLVDTALVIRLRLGLEPMPLAFDFRSMGDRTAAAHFAEGAFEGLAFGVVPLIAYAYTTSELGLGGLFSLFALAGGVVTATLGVASDRLRNRQSFLVAGAAASAVAALLVVRASSLAEFAFANSLVSLSSSVAPLFLFTIAVERFPGRIGPALITRELLLNGGRTTSLTASFLLIALGLSAQHAFVVGAVSLAFVALGKPASRGPASTTGG